MTIQLTTFAYGPIHMDLGAGMVTDANGQVSVPTGAAGGSNAWRRRTQRDPSGTRASGAEDSRL
jgi:hypothetical protein